MILLQKWNFKTHKYEPFESPAVFITGYSEDMNARTDCANCGKEQRFGECYTSRTIHTEMGLGYPVCEPCYAAEREAEEASKENG